MQLNPIAVPASHPGASPAGQSLSSTQVPFWVHTAFWQLVPPPQVSRQYIDPLGPQPPSAPQAPLQLMPSPARHAPSCSSWVKRRPIRHALSYDEPLTAHTGCTVEGQLEQTSHVHP